MRPAGMKKAVLGLLLSFLVQGPVSPGSLTAQQSQELQDDDKAYDSRFFDQLRTIFGRFRDSDLEKVFQDARLIECSELLGRMGEWRPVAFFNEDRDLGDWCRENLEDVKSDLAVYTFKGECSGKKEAIQVTTRFPIADSYELYRQQRIELDRVDVIKNDPVTATLNRRTQAYTFELPYLFLDSVGSKKVYSLVPPDHNAIYSRDVASRWECKAVSSKDVTYRFLICKVETFPPGRIISPNQKWYPSFGSSAFFILSDGMEAKSSVKFTFGDEK